MTNVQCTTDKTCRTSWMLPDYTYVVNAISSFLAATRITHMYDNDKIDGDNRSLLRAINLHHPIIASQ